MIGGPAHRAVRAQNEERLGVRPEQSNLGQSALFTTDGVALAGLHWPPSSDPPVAAVVLVHGLAARKDHPHIEALAGRLQENSFEVLSYDARGHGASAGTYTLGHLEHLDVEAAAAWAMGRGVPTILVGASLGGVAVLRYACDHPELTGVVIVSSPAEWRIPLRLRALLTVGLVRTRPGRWIARRRMGVRISSRMDGGRSTSDID